MGTNFFDNYSNDNSFEFINKFNDNRIKYYKSFSKFLTLLVRLERLQIHLKGDLIGILDSDDIWLKDKLSNQIKYFDDKKVGLVFSASKYFNSKKTNKSFSL